MEDSRDVMMFVRSALDVYGGDRYILRWATCLHEGLDQLSAGGVDIVLLDLGLPDSSGPSSCSVVRAMAAEIPILVLTGDACEDTERVVNASGMDDYLVKDHVSAGVLVQAISASIHAMKVQQRQKVLANRLTSRAANKTRPG